MTDTDRTRIVAIRPGALGDTLLVFPALALLRRAHPDAHITLVARRDVLPLAYTWGLADALEPYDAPEWSALFAPDPPSDSPLRAILAGATVVAWLADRDGLVAASLRALGAETVAIGPGRPREDIQTHAALQLAAPLAALGIPVPADTAALHTVLPSLPLPPADAIVGACGGRPPDALISPASRQPDLLSPLSPQGAGSARNAACSKEKGGQRPGVRTPVALHAGSGGAAKRWPPERFAALAGEIRQLAPKTILIEGPQDGDVTSVVLAEMERLGMRPPVVARDLDPLALAWLLIGAVAYVGNDSGVSHLAGLLSVPTLALFGPTDPAIWSPLGLHARVLRSPAGALADLSVAPVAALLRQMLA